jgi:hypothetical protein
MFPEYMRNLGSKAEKEASATMKNKPIKAIGTSAPH